MLPVVVDAPFGTGTRPGRVRSDAPHGHMAVVLAIGRPDRRGRNEVRRCVTALWWRLPEGPARWSRGDTHRDVCGMGLFCQDCGLNPHSRVPRESTAAEKQANCSWALFHGRMRREVTDEDLDGQRNAFASHYFDHTRGQYLHDYEATLRLRRTEHGCGGELPEQRKSLCPDVLCDCRSRSVSGP
jgi:hypothetical protein